MIITKIIRIKNSSFYKLKGYISDSDGFIEINVNNLSNSSSHIILAKCDFCEAEKKIKYLDYIKNIKNINIFSCSKKCGRNKAKITNLEKYGVENISQSSETKVKVKNTNLEKFGVEYASQNQDIKNKTKNTNLEKFGVEYASQNQETKIKTKNTNLEKFGFEYASQNQDIRNKTKNTNLEKFGVEHVLQNKAIHTKKKKTCLEKFGFEYASQNQEIKEKIKNTNNKLFNSDFFYQSEQSKNYKIIGSHINYKRYLGNNISLFKCDLNKDHVFETNSDNFHSRIKQNNPLCTICYPIGNSRSIKEELIYEYIKSIYLGKIIQSYRDGLEIDIYLPELNIGIEFNGLYWHSNKFKENDYHINKLNYFKERKIDIKIIYEDDFDNNLDIIKSQISHWLKLTKPKIYARKCLVKEVKNYRDFLNNNHIQGFVACKIVYGLYYQDSLVSLMSFDKKEGRLNMEESGWNLNRFCNLLNTNIIGGASKLLNHFIKENNPKRVISYADKDWSNGNLYNVLGFNLVNESKPDYKYIVDGLRKSKQNFTKTKLAKMGHDISLTEAQIMNNLGINRIYDCGKMKFEKYI